MERRREDKLARWYFGGMGSAMAAGITHPLDLLKVQLQTQQETRTSVIKVAAHIAKTHGIRYGFYNGISASLLRQMTYSLTRFGMYEVGKQSVGPNAGFGTKVFLASFAGACGGFIGTPGDLINVRMQNDSKLAPELRRNYKNAIDGVIRVYTEEGLTRLWSGTTMATSRAIFMTVGQLAFYDQVKVFLLATGVFSDTPSTHFLSSFTAATIATMVTQPLDVMKTRAMNAKPGEFNNLFSVFVSIAKLGPLGFFKGFVPAFVRLAPQTILTFVFLEQLRLNFGFYKAK